MTQRSISGGLHRGSVISMLPAPDDTGNIYTVLLYRALERAGLRYLQIPFSVRHALLRSPADRFHYVHFHWPEIFFVLRPRAPFKLFGLKGYLRLHALWLALKLRGYHLVWTVHEVDPHDARQVAWAHALSRRLLWNLADVVFTHSPDVRAEAERRWGRKRHVHTIPIGSYDGAYPATLGRSEARARLGIPEDAFAFVFFGNVRPYKGIDLLIEAFRNLLPEHPSAHLVLAGRPNSEAFRAEVEASLHGLPQTHAVLRYVPDDEVQLYLRAADCFVAPYKYVQTCSAIYLALAFDLPVIIKSEGNVVEFEGLDIGVFMRDSRELGAAMRRMLEMPAAERERLRANARAAARLYSWDRLEQRYRDAFERFEAERRGV